MAFHVEQAEFEHGEQADRPCPDNQNVRLCDAAHALRLDAETARHCMSTAPMPSPTKR
jgi:hypothetical protein